MRPIWTLLTLVLILTAIGCDTTTVYVDHDPAADFSDLKTYYWAPVVENDQNILATDPIVNARLRNAVDQYLSQNGFAKQTSDTPDFYVGAFVTVNERTSVTNVNNYYAYDGNWGYGYASRPYSSSGVHSGSRRYVYHYQQGTLIIDISRADNKQLIWRATADGELDNKSKDQKEKDKRLTELIEKMFKDFPPEKQ